MQCIKKGVMQCIKKGVFVKMDGQILKKERIFWVGDYITVRIYPIFVLMVSDILLMIEIQKH